MGQCWQNHFTFSSCALRRQSTTLLWNEGGLGTYCSVLEIKGPLLKFQDTCYTLCSQFFGAMVYNTIYV